MFKREEIKPEEGVDTIIGPSVNVEGNFKGDGNIIVEGEVKGSLKTKGFIRITANANILASINAGSAEVSGQVTGNLKIREHLDIKESAVITGDIEAKTISIAFGAIVNGNLKMKNDKAGAMEEAAAINNNGEEEKK